MTKLLLFTGFLFFASCKSGTKEQKENPASHIDTPVTLKDTPVVNNPAPAGGKIDIETFGDIKIGQPITETIKALGEPGSKSTPVEWGADGMMHEDWTYKDKSLVINVASEVKSKDNNKTIFSITAEAPCAFKTRANMGIGNSYEEVQAAYKRDIDLATTDKTQITVGSVYGGIIFTFSGNKVSKIFLGAAAE